MRRSYIILLALMFISVNAIAGVGVWTSTNGPYGGRINRLAFTPDGSSVYATGVGGVYKSIDEGETWVNIAPNLVEIAGSGSSAIAIHSISSETLYIGFGTFIYKTVDGGNSWTQLHWFGQGIDSIRIDKDDTNVIYAKVSHSGLYRSIDGGKSWSRLGRGVAGLGGGRIKAFEISPTQPNTVYAFSYYHDAQRDGYYIQKSEDAGNSWTIVSDNLTDSNPTMWDINTLAINPIEPNIIYATGHNGLYKSVDSGKSWTQTILADSGSFQAMVINSQNPDIIYASASQGERAGVLKSLDSGNTWSKINSGLTNRSVWTLAINPASPDVILVGTFGGGVFKTVNGGDSWTESSFGLNKPIIISLAVAPTSPSTIYAGTLNGNGIYKSTDSGMTWAQINFGLTTTRTSYYVSDIVVDTKNPMIVYAATLDGIFKSVNGGDNWKKVNFESTIATDLAIDPVTTSTIYAVSSGMSLDDGIYKSIDGGNSWKHISSGLPVGERNIHTVVIHPTVPGILYAGTGGGVFKSIDAGESWINTVADEDRILRINGYDLAINPVTPNVLYVTGSNRSMFKSINDGDTWERIGSATHDITSLIVHPTTSNVLYTGNNGGVFRSADSGMTWTQINYGLANHPNTMVRAMAFDPTRKTIYVGTEGGIFSYTESLLPTSLARLAISPDELSLTSGETQQFTLTAEDENNNLVAIEPKDVIWEVVGDIGNIDDRGMFTAISAGSGKIKATLKSNTFIFDQNNHVTVSPGPIASIIISPYFVGSETAFSGWTRELDVRRAYDMNNNSIKIREKELNWEVIGQIGEISTNGHFTATKAGKGKIKASLKDDPSIFYEIDLIVIGPDPPILNPIETPAKRNIVALTGERQLQHSSLSNVVYEVEVFVNGISKGITKTDSDTGTFIISDILLLKEHNEITAKVKDPVGNVSDASTPIVISLLTSPEDLTLKQKANGRIELSWQAPKDETVSVYNLYRSEKEFEQISQLTPVASKISETTYSDQLEEYGTYFYAITALDADGNEGLPSDIVKVEYSTPKLFLSVEKEVNAGDVFAIEVKAENMFDLFGFQFDLEFNSSLLEVKEVKEGSFLNQDGVDTFWKEPEIDNQKGVVRNASAIRLQKSSVSGSGVLANITLKAISPGTSILKLENVKLSNPNAESIFNVQIEDSLTLTVTVPWDLDRNGIIDVFDLVHVGIHFGEEIPPDTEPNPDVNRDGVVNIFDLVLVGSHFGEQYEVSPASPEKLFVSDTAKIKAKTRILEDNILRIEFDSEGTTVYGFQFNVNFNPKVLEALAVSEGTMLANSQNRIFSPTPQMDNSAGKIANIVGCQTGDSAKSFKGSLSIIDFRIKDLDFTTPSTIHLSNVKLVNQQGNRVQPVIQNLVIDWEKLIVPEKTALMQNYPNPFNPETWIPFQLKDPGNVVISIYDIHGRLVRKIGLGNMPAGVYVSKDRAVYWDGRNQSGERVSSGVYFYQLQAGEYRGTKRMLILK